MSMKRCSTCKTEKLKVDFSATQWKKKKDNTCKTCTEFKAKVTSKTSTEDKKIVKSPEPHCLEFRSGVINVPVVGLEHRLLLENQELVAENNHLRMQLANYENQVCYLKKWELSQEELKKLQEENLRLRNENEVLKKEVTALKGQVGILMKSHFIESKIAIRVLITEVKKMGLEHISEDVRKLAQKLKNSVNAAAHVATPPRILQAIEEEKVERTRDTLMEMFNRIYGKCENDSDYELTNFDDF